MSREPVRHGALLSAVLFAGLMVVPAVQAQNCDQCKQHCPPWIKYRFEGPPRIKFKHGCPKPICDPCTLPHYGYFQTCWHPWPFPPDWSHCPVPPPGTQVPYEHPGRRQTVFEPPTDGAKPRRVGPAIDKGTSSESPDKGSPDKSMPETVSPNKVLPAAGKAEPATRGPSLPPSPLPALSYDPHSSNPASVLPFGPNPDLKKPPSLPPLTPTAEPPHAGLKASPPPVATAPTPKPASGVQQVAAVSPTPERAQRPRTVGVGSPASNVRMVNSRRIMLDYDLADVPHPEQTQLELWFTQDGKRWQKDQTTLRGGSPYLVEVNREGTYGFTLVARRPGDESSAPAAGEAPQVWVEVDWTKPIVHMVHAKPNGRDKQLDIIWIATDNNLAKQPITLAYAEQPKGPWKAFASNIENTGRYAWQPPANAPKRLYLRVEATDLVGNIGSGQTPMPVVR